MILTLLSLILGTHYKETKAYSQQTLALSILLTALLALVLGFTVGLLVSRRCHQQKQLHLTEIYDKTLNFTKWVCVTIKNARYTKPISVIFSPFFSTFFAYVHAYISKRYLIWLIEMRWCQCFVDPIRHNKPINLVRDGLRDCV